MESDELTAPFVGVKAKSAAPDLTMTSMPIAMEVIQRPCGQVCRIGRRLAARLSRRIRFGAPGEGKAHPALFSRVLPTVPRMRGPSRGDRACKQEYGEQ